MCRTHLNDEPRVLLDPNTWSEDGAVALAGLVPSDDGRFVAYGVARCRLRLAQVGT